MKRLTPTAVVRLAVSALIAAAALFFLWPTSIGGATGYVTVDGTSMQPLLHTGDLVLVRKQANYHVGDLVAFHIDGGNVIHRLHAGDAETGFTTKGDNRDQPDPWVIKPGQIIGQRWLLVPGPVNPLTHLHGVVPLAVALCLILLYRPTRALRATTRRRRRLRKGLPVGTKLGLSSRRDCRRLLASALALGVVAVLAATVAGIAFSTSTKVASTVATGPQQQVAYSYTIHEQPSPLDPSGIRTVTTGSAAPTTLFSKLTDSIDVHVTWSTSSDAGVSGTYSADEAVAVPGVWSKSVPGAAPQPFSGNTLTFTVPVNMRDLTNLADSITEATGTAGGQVLISVTPTIRSHSSAAGTLLASVPIALTSNGSTIQLPAAGSQTVAPPTKDVVNTRTLRLGAVHVGVQTARVVGAAIFVVALYVLALVAARLRRTWDVAIAYRLRTRFGSALVKVGAGPRADEPVIPIAEFDDLARAAACNDGVINLFAAGEERTLFVRTPATTYVMRWQVGDTGSRGSKSDSRRRRVALAGRRRRSRGGATRDACLAFIAFPDADR